MLTIGRLVHCYIMILYRWMQMNDEQREHWNFDPIFGKSRISERRYARVTMLITLGHLEKPKSNSKVRIRIHIQTFYLASNVLELLQWANVLFCSEVLIITLSLSGAHLSSDILDFPNWVNISWWWLLFSMINRKIPIYCIISVYFAYLFATFIFFFHFSYTLSFSFAERYASSGWI